MHRVRAPDGLRADLRQAGVSDVAGLHEIGDRADGVLDRHRGVEAPGAMRCRCDRHPGGSGCRRGNSSPPRGARRDQPAPVGRAHDAELHRHHRLVPPIAQGAADRFPLCPAASLSRGQSTRTATRHGRSRRRMVAMLSASSDGPYIPDIPMHPSASGNTRGPCAPSSEIGLRRHARQGRPAGLPWEARTSGVKVGGRAPAAGSARGGGPAPGRRR